MNDLTAQSQSDSPASSSLGYADGSLPFQRSVPRTQRRELTETVPCDRTNQLANYE